MEDVNTILQQLAGFAENGQIQEGLTLCVQALQTHPDCAQLYYFNAYLGLQKALGESNSSFDVESFRNLLIRATELDPAYTAPHKLWAQVAVELLNQPELAESAYTRALAANTQDWEAYAMRGQMRLQMGKLQEAIEDFSALINAGQDKVQMYAYRAHAYFLQGNCEAAQSDYLKAIELNPQYGGGFIGLGRIDMARGDFSSAVENFSKVLALFPDYAPGYGLRGNAKDQLGDSIGTLADYQKALDLDPESEAALNAVRQYQQKLLEKVPQGTEVMHITLKNGRKAMTLPLDGQLVTLYDLEPEPVDLNNKEEAKSAAAAPAPDAHALGRQLINECATNHLDKVRELIAAGAGLQTEICGETPLLKAIKRGCADIVRELLAAGADINFVTKAGKTPLSEAAAFKQWEILEILLAHEGLQLNQLDAFRKHPADKNRQGGPVRGRQTAGRSGRGRKHQK